MDLIAFDSPSVLESGKGKTENESAQRILDFESIWNSDKDMQQRARGWYDAPVEQIVRRLQGINHYHLQIRPADMLPFAGKCQEFNQEASQHANPVTQAI